VLARPSISHQTNLRHLFRGQRWSRGTAALLAAVIGLAAFAAGCGEKDEPSLAELEQSATTTTTGGDSGKRGFEIEGEWKGQLRQKGLQPFTVRARIADLDDPKRNTVHYTGIDCSGTWNFEGRDGSSYEFEEVIDRGEGGSCKGVGTVTLSPASGDTLDYQFRGGGVESEGVLERVG
jgi:hypothetical protein